MKKIKIISDPYAEEGVYDFATTKEEFDKLCEKAGDVINPEDWDIYSDSVWCYGFVIIQLGDSPYALMVDEATTRYTVIK